jgi:hypothetical protein
MPCNLPPEVFEVWGALAKHCDGAAKHPLQNSDSFITLNEEWLWNCEEVASQQHPAYNGIGLAEARSAYEEQPALLMIAFGTKRNGEICAFTNWLVCANTYE